MAILGALFVLSVSPGLLSPVLVQVGLAGVAECDLSLPAVDPSARAIAVVIPVPAGMLVAVGEAAALAAGIEGIGAFVPPA